MHLFVKAVTTVVPDIQVQRPIGLALWVIIIIIIVAIIIGIFLLCLIMLLLWKVPFSSHLHLIIASILWVS